MSHGTGIVLYIVPAIIIASVLVLVEVEAPYRVIIVVPFVLFLPGYAFMAAVWQYTRRQPSALGVFDVLGLSAGFSIAITALVGVTISSFRMLTATNYIWALSAVTSLLLGWAALGTFQSKGLKRTVWLGPTISAMLVGMALIGTLFLTAKLFSPPESLREALFFTSSEGKMIDGHVETTPNATVSIPIGADLRPNHAYVVEATLDNGSTSTRVWRSDDALGPAWQSMIEFPSPTVAGMYTLRVELSASNEVIRQIHLPIHVLSENGS